MKLIFVLFLTTAAITETDALIGIADDHGHKDGKVVKCSAVADIIFVLDTSSCKSEQELQLEKEFSISLSQHFFIGKFDTRIAALSFGDKVVKMFDLKDYADHDALKTRLSAADVIGGEKKTYQALDYIRENQLFSTEAGGRDAASKIVVVITGGCSDSLIKTKNAVDALRATNVKVLFVGIGNVFGLDLWSIAGIYDNLFTVDLFNSLRDIEQKVARRICEIIVIDGNGKEEPGETNENECTTGNQKQDCVFQDGSNICTCKPDFTVNPEDNTTCIAIKPCTYLGDILFVLDSSGSIGVSNYRMQQLFASNLTRYFTFGENGALYAGLLFSDEATLLFNFSTFTQLSEIRTALSDAPYISRSTGTDLAFRYIYENQLFSTANGGRASAKDTVILLTDGVSNNKVKTELAADELKRRGVRIIVVGIGDGISTDEITKIASSSDDIFFADDFSYLDYIAEKLKQQVCKG